MRRLLAAAAAAAAAVAIAVAMPAATSAQVPITGYSLEAWCVGGFAGRWDKARIASDGAISATNSAIQPTPWPVVASEPILAGDWIGRAIAAEAQAIDNGTPVYRDGINCGLDLYHPDGSKTPCSLIDIFEGLIGYVPPRGF
ncbi:MAG: hypothetical protein KIS68_16395 [Bauldia sp.]|nr:hypothetical protein [Bauldia sp.]